MTLKVTLKVAFKVISKPILYKPRVLVSLEEEKEKREKGKKVVLCFLGVSSFFSTFSFVLSSSGSCIE